MGDDQRRQGVAKLETGIPGFDFVSKGGLPAGRTSLMSGTAGSGKTIFAAQFLAEGVHRGESGVFVTFEEPPDAIQANLASFGWDIPAWEREGRWAFVDVSPRTSEEEIIAGSYDLGALIPRVEYGVQKVGASRVVIDSLAAFKTQFSDQSLVRHALFSLTVALRRLGVTALITAERTDEYGDIARYGVEEFVADTVMVLRNALEGDKRRRTVEIVKMRGTSHHAGEFPFTISAESSGVVVVPLAAIDLNQVSSGERITTGSADLDAMCNGGVYRDTISLVTGPTGTGKTLVASHFIGGGQAFGDRCLLVAFEEGRQQLMRNAAGWGLDFEGMEAAGLLRIEAAYPETRALEDHLVRLKALIDVFQPHRLVIDSLSALERVSGRRGFKEFVIALVAFIRAGRTAALLTANSPSLRGGESATEAQISSMTDTIILLRYVEWQARIRRGLTVLKMRGSNQDKHVREYTIDDQGLHIHEPLVGPDGDWLGLGAPSSEV